MKVSVMARTSLLALLLVALAMPAGARGVDFADNATPFDGQHGCTCTEGGKTWGCRKLVDNWSSAPPVMSCPENRKAPCRWRHPYVAGFLMICIEQDRQR
jgi:hypothetical protein